MTPDERWEQGTKHHPESLALIYAMREVDDDSQADDILELGGDGDEGELIACLLDECIDRGYISIRILQRELLLKALRLEEE